MRFTRRLLAPTLLVTALCFAGAACSSSGSSSKSSDTTVASTTTEKVDDDKKSDDDSKSDDDAADEAAFCEDLKTYEAERSILADEDVDEDSDDFKDAVKAIHDTVKDMKKSAPSDVKADVDNLDFDAAIIEDFHLHNRGHDDKALDKADSDKILSAHESLATYASENCGFELAKDG